jgi:hypothetical protein
MTVTLPTRNELAQIAGGNQRYIKWLEDVTKGVAGLGPLATLAPTGTADATTFLRGDGAWADPFPNGKLMARVNFNGTGVIAIRSAANVASITDNGTGDYTINFSPALSDANYSVALSYSDEFNVQHGVGFIISQTASALRLKFHSPANSAQTVDKSIVCVAVFR